MTARATTWSHAFPGLVMRTCGDADGAFEVHNGTGRNLRQASFAYLCFDCGPAGGVYHPEANRLDEHRADGELGDWEPPTFEQVRAEAAELDRYHNRFELHEHHVDLSAGQSRTITHSHTEGDDVHRHPDAGWASFTPTADERAAAGFGRVGPKVRPTSPAPKGEQLGYVAPTDDERLFRVLAVGRYSNPMSVQGMGKRGKPDEQWSRRAHRHTTALIVYAARRRLLGHDEVLVGPGAVTMAAARMHLFHRLTPVYEIAGWTPSIGMLP